MGFKQNFERKMCVVDLEKKDIKMEELLFIKIVCDLAGKLNSVF